jgi:signal transduction histidine kinase
LPFSSILSLPLKTNSSFYGKIYFINKFNQTVFSPSDQRFMMTLSYKFAICYENLLLRQEIKTHSQQLEEVTDRLHLTLDAAKLGTWSWAVKNKELILDKYACLLLGLNPEDPPKTIDALFACVVPEDRACINKTLFENNNSDLLRFRIIWPDKTIRYFSLRAKTYFDAKGEPVRILGVYWDITEQVQAEEKFRAYQKQIAETIRSNSLGEMASSLAHEINQPLTAISAYIKGCVRRLESKKEVTPEIIEILNEASAQAERAGEVVHRIKNYVRKGELFYETVDINIVIAHVIHLINQEIQNLTVKIIYSPNESLNMVRIDRIQIEQVILNLLRNAIEAMQEANTHNPQITIEVNSEKDSYITVRMLDNGPGYSEQIANHLFEMYFTTKTQGMGLGLAICRSMIEAHSGHLSASRLPTGGSCFEFDLPIKEKCLSPSNTVPAPIA